MAEHMFQEQPSLNPAIEDVVNKKLPEQVVENNADTEKKFVPTETGMHFASDDRIAELKNGVSADRGNRPAGRLTFQQNTIEHIDKSLDDEDFKFPAGHFTNENLQMERIKRGMANDHSSPLNKKD